MRYAISKIKDELEKASIEASQNYRLIKQQYESSVKNVDSVSTSIQARIRAIVESTFILPNGKADIEKVTKYFPSLAKKVNDTHTKNISELSRFNSEIQNINRQIEGYTVHSQIKTEVLSLENEVKALNNNVHSYLVSGCTTDRAKTLNTLAVTKGWYRQEPGWLIKFISQDHKDWKDLNNEVKQSLKALNLNQYLEKFTAATIALKQKEQTLYNKEQEYLSAEKHLESLKRAQNTIKTNIVLTKQNDETLTEYTKNELCKLIIDSLGNNKKFDFLPDGDRNSIVDKLVQMDVYLNIKDGIKKQFDAADKIDTSFADAMKKINKSRKRSKQIDFDMQGLQHTTIMLKKENDRLSKQGPLLRRQSEIISSYRRSNFSSNRPSTYNSHDDGTPWLLYYMLYTTLAAPDVHATAAILQNTEAPPVENIIKNIDADIFPDLNLDALSEISKINICTPERFDFNDSSFDKLNESISDVTSTIDNTRFDTGSSGYSSSSDYGSSSYDSSSSSSSGCSFD